MISIDNFAVDTATRITPTFKGKATQHPLEKGRTAVDHVIDEPDGLSMDVIVSDNPIGEMVTIRARESGVPSERAFYTFLNLKRSKKIITVITDHRTYTDMILVEFTPTFDKNTGEALRCTLVFQAFSFIENDRAFVPVATPLASKKDTRGNKSGKKPPDSPADAKADRNSSILWKLTH